MFKALMNFLPQADILYVALFAALGGWALYEHHHLIAEGEAHEVAALKASSDKLTAQNVKDNAAKEAAWAADSKQVGDLYETTLNVQSAAINLLNGRLRDALAHSGKVTVPGGTATPGESYGPTPIPGGLSSALEGVVTAANHDADQVIALQTYVTKVCH